MADSESGTNSLVQDVMRRVTPVRPALRLACDTGSFKICRLFDGHLSFQHHAVRANRRKPTPLCVVTVPLQSKHGLSAPQSDSDSKDSSGKECQCITHAQIRSQCRTPWLQRWSPLDARSRVAQLAQPPRCDLRLNLPLDPGWMDALECPRLFHGLQTQHSTSVTICASQTKQAMARHRRLSTPCSTPARPSTRLHVHCPLAHSADTTCTSRQRLHFRGCCVMHTLGLSQAQVQACHEIRHAQGYAHALPWAWAPMNLYVNHCKAHPMKHAVLLCQQDHRQGRIHLYA